jgi:hypothetical protein
LRRPDESLKPRTNTPAHYAGRLTRRAGVWGWLVWSAGLAHNPLGTARFRRAAQLEAVRRSVDLRSGGFGTQAAHGISDRRLDLAEPT